MEMPFPGMQRAPEPQSRPLPEAQAMELRRRFLLREEASDLKPGDLCTEKEGLEALNGHIRRGTLMLVVRHLDLSSWADRILYETALKNGSLPDPDVDCFAAILDLEGDLSSMLHK